MDLDLLHIKLTAYALGELDAAQKADIERILTENQEARDQVARAKNVAKAIKDLLPQSSDDVQPMTPDEYRARRHEPRAMAVQPYAPEPMRGGESMPAAAPSTSPASNGIVLLLVAGCLILAAGWLYQWKSTPPAPRQLMVPAAELEAKDARLKVLTEDLQRTKDALDKELAARSEADAKNADLEAGKAKLAASADEISAENQTLGDRVWHLESALAHAASAASAIHHPFTPTQAQLVAMLPATGHGDTLARIQNALRDGEWPLPDLVDAGELVQSFTYDYPAPPPGQSLPAMGTALAVCPWNKEHLLARVTLAAGTEAVTLASLQIEFNPTRVAAWRIIGHEVRDGDGRPVGGQGTGMLKPGAEVTVMCEIQPTQDPLAPLLAKRAELTQKFEDAKRAVSAASDLTTLTEAKLTADGLRLDLADLDEQVAKAKGVQQQAWRFLAPAQPTAAAAQGDWLAATASVVPADAGPTAVEASLRGAAKPFPEADADFRLAATAAAFGLVLRHSPQRGEANLDLVEALLKDLPAGEGAQILAPLVEEARKAADAPTPEEP